MSLFERLKADQLQYRKDGTKQFASALGVVIAEASKNDKTPSDETVTATIRKLLKSLDEVLQHAPNGSDAHLRAAVEKHLLEQYIPAMLTREQLAAHVMHASDLPEITMKNMKAIKAQLEAQFPGQIDGKLLAETIKEVATV